MGFREKGSDGLFRSLLIKAIGPAEALTNVLDIQNDVATSKFSVTKGGAMTAAGTATFTGNIAQTGSGTLSTGTGAIALNGSVTMAAGKTLTLGSGALVPGTGGVTPISAPSHFSNAMPIAATTGTDVFFANGTQFVSSIFIPCNMTLTGVGFLIGSVGGTDKIYAVLYDSAGNNLANSSLTASGATVGTAANTQTLAFSPGTYAAKGPGLFFVGLSANGGTAKLRAVPNFCGAGIFCGSVAQTHGTVAAITAPSAFAADKAPYLWVY